MITNNNNNNIKKRIKCETEDEQQSSNKRLCRKIVCFVYNILPQTILDYFPNNSINRPSSPLAVHSIDEIGEACPSSPLAPLTKLTSEKPPSTSLIPQTILDYFPKNSIDRPSSPVPWDERKQASLSFTK